MAAWWKFALPALLVAMIVAILLWKPWKKRETTCWPACSLQTETQKLTQQARVLIDDDPLAGRENFGWRKTCASAGSVDHGWRGLGDLARATISLISGNYENTLASQVPKARPNGRAFAPDSADPDWPWRSILTSNQAAEADVGCGIGRRSGQFQIAQTLPIA
jgi:hypothetical protein